MRIAFGLVSREAGGAEFQTVLLADQLRRRGHHVTLYCTQPAASEAMLAQVPPLPCRVATPPPWLPGRLGTLALAAQGKTWLLRDRIDAAVGILALPHALLTLACLGTRIRLVGRRSAVWSECQEYGTYAAHVPRLQRWVRRWGWRTSAMVCNAEEVVRSAQECEGWPADRVHLIPNGWPECPASDCASDLPVYCARPRAEKRVDLATQEFARAGVPLALAFEPPDWSQVGILVHASRADALSNSVGMAMAHGIPAVAFRLPGNRALLGDAYCVERWHYGLLARRVKDLRRNRRERLLAGNELRARVRERFPLAGMVDSWESLLAKGGTA